VEEEEEEDEIHRRVMCLFTITRLPEGERWAAAAGAAAAWVGASTPRT
jgi:hypothetical protein